MTITCIQWRERPSSTDSIFFLFRFYYVEVKVYRTMGYNLWCFFCQCFHMRTLASIHHRSRSNSLSSIHIHNARICMHIQLPSTWMSSIFSAHTYISCFFLLPLLLLLLLVFRLSFRLLPTGSPRLHHNFAFSILRTPKTATAAASTSLNTITSVISVIRDTTNILWAGTIAFVNATQAIAM